MNNKNLTLIGTLKRIFGDGFLVIIAPAIGYICNFAYMLGYLNYFDLPINLVRVSINSLLFTSIFIILASTVVYLPIFVFRKRVYYIHYIRGFSNIVIIILLYSYEIVSITRRVNPKHDINFLQLALIIIIITLFIFFYDYKLLIRIKKSLLRKVNITKKEYRLFSRSAKEELNTRVYQLYTEEIIKYRAHMKNFNINNNMYINIILFTSCFIAISYFVGLFVPSYKKTYSMINTSSNIIIMEYKDGYITMPVNLSDNIIERKFSYYELNTKDIINVVETGVLKLKDK